MKYINITKKLLLVIAITGIVILSGCTGKDTTQTTTTDSKEKTTDSSPGTTAKKTVQAVHFSKLIEFLPAAPSGYTAEEPQGSSYTIEEGTWSMASRSYKKGDSGRADVSIMDSAYYEVGLFGAWKGLQKFESTEGYYKTTTVNGFPAFETYSKSSKQYGLYVNVKDRFMVYIIVDDDDKQTLTAIENSINYAGIAALD